MRYCPHAMYCYTTHQMAKDCQGCKETIENIIDETILPDNWEKSCKDYVEQNPEWED